MDGRWRNIKRYGTYPCENLCISEIGTLIKQKVPSIELLVRVADVPPLMFSLTAAGVIEYSDIPI